MPAFSNANVKQTVVEAFFEGVHQVDERFMDYQDYRNDDIADLRISPISGVSEIGEWGGGDLPVQELEALNPQAVAYTKYGVQVRVDKYAAKDVPESVTTLPQRIGTAVASTYAKRAASTLNAAFSTATTSVDGLALCSTSHTVKTGGTRSNLLTSALDSSALMAGIKTFRKWLDYQGTSFDMVALGGFYLVIPPDLEEAAGQALGSAVTSSANQLNMAGSYGIEVRVNPFLTDTNNYFLVSKAMSPLIFWERSAVDLVVDIDTDSKAGKYSVDFAIAAAVSAIPDGIVGFEVT
jgi:hypothetical protein